MNGSYGRFDFVTGVYYFEEEGENDQNPTIFLGGPGTFTIGQKVDSFAVYGNVGYAVSDQLRLSAGLRYTEDEKDARVDINGGLIATTANRDWDEVSWDVSASYDVADRLTMYGSIANGYQSGQFPPRPFCLFGSFDFGAGVDTRNIIVDQDSVGLELEGTLALADNFFIHTSLGYIDVDVDDPVAVAPLTPELTASFSPEYSFRTAGGGLVTLRGDWSYRDEMYGEPTADAGRFTFIDSRDLINLDLSYRSANDRWTVGLYGRNVTDERYDQARLNTGDYILVMLSNDASEFGVRWVTDF